MEGENLIALSLGIGAGAGVVTDALHYDASLALYGELQKRGAPLGVVKPRGTRIEVLAAQQAVSLAQRSLETTQKGLSAAEEGYRVRKELLNAERATAVELVDAETELTRSRIAALNARVDLRVARAQLDHALGNDAGNK